jgi:hypothetical protein
MDSAFAISSRGGRALIAAPGPARRAAGFIALVLHLLLGVAVPLLHADAGAHTSGEVHLHAPEDRDLSCLPTHDELVCQVCRALTTRVLTPAEASSLLGPIRSSDFHRLTVSAPVQRSLNGSLRARAPPSVA